VKNIDIASSAILKSGGQLELSLYRYSKILRNDKIVCRIVNNIRIAATMVHIAHLS